MSKWALNLGAVELKAFLWGFAPTRGEGTDLLVWKGCCLQGNGTRQRQHRMSLQSVSNSETDVTVNLSTFRTSSSANSTKSSIKAMDGPQQRLGTE